MYICQEKFIQIGEINNKALSRKEELNIKFFFSKTNHEASDNCGVEILGQEDKSLERLIKVQKLIQLR